MNYNQKNPFTYGTTIRMDSETNMPSIPEDQFWRVSRHDKYWSHVSLHQTYVTSGFLWIKPKTKSFVVDWHPVEAEDTTPEKVQEAAMFIIDTLMRKGDVTTTMFGDYPPNTLNI